VSWKRLFTQHYRSLRAAIGDWRSKKSRPEIDKLACRANPIQRAKYITASTWHQDVQKWQHINGN